MGIYQLHAQLLDSLHEPVCSILLLSNLLHLQETQKESAALVNAMLAHTLILALVVKVAIHRALAPLSQYAVEIKNQREEAGQLPSSVSVDMKDGSFVVNENAPTKDDVTVTIFFEKDVVLTILSEDKELSSVFDLGTIFEQNAFAFAYSDADVDSAKLE